MVPCLFCGQEFLCSGSRCTAERQRDKCREWGSFIALSGIAQRPGPSSSGEGEPLREGGFSEQSANNAITT